VKYQNYLETTPTRLGKPMAPNSINRKISSISSFYQFLLQREIVDKNPVEFCNRPKRINVSDTEAFNDAEMKRFFQLIARKSATSTPGNTTTALYDGNEKSRG
jgi:integrase/recombinase XerD